MSIFRSRIFSGTLLTFHVCLCFVASTQMADAATIAEFDMNSDPGWTAGTGWAYGAPSGTGGDPVSGHTGANVYGYNLSGVYENNIATTRYVRTSTTIFCAQYTNVHLTFWRWLGVDQSSNDQARVQVSRDASSWTTVYANSASVNDTGWTQVDYDVSAVADGSTLFVRWGMGPTDGSVQFGGWNIDDVVITGTPLNHAPVSDPGGPYQILEGQSLELDGSGSSDPDDPPDGIISYSWDVNGDSIFGDASDAATPTLTWSQLQALGLGAPYSGSLSLRVMDSNGASSVQSTTLTITEDNDPPVAAVGAPSTSTTNSGPVTYTVSYTGASSVSLALGDITLNKTDSADGVVAVSGTGTSTRTVEISNITGDGTLGISIDAGTASDTAGNLAAAAGPSATFSVDNTAPGVSIGAPSASLTNDGPVTYTVSYTGASVVDLDESEVDLNTTGDATGTVAVSGTGAASRTVTISDITGDGSLGIGIDAGTASDAAGNTADAAGASATFNVDNIAPTVSIGAAVGSPVSVTRTASFPVTISGANSYSLDSGDVSINHSGTADGSVNILDGTSATPTVEVTGVTGDGSYTISLAAEIAEDAAGNLSAAAGPSVSAVTVDNTGPTVSIGAPAGSPVNSSGTASFPITITGSTSVSMSNFHVTLNLSGVTGGSITIVDGSTATPTVEVSGVTGNGTYTISLASGIASDALDNTSGAVGPSAAVTVDNAAPGISLIAAPSPGITNDGPMQYTVAYTGADSISLAEGDVTLNSTGGDAAGTVAVSGSGLTDRTVTISDITGDGTLGISVGAGTAADAAGNSALAAGPSSTFTVDNTAPSISISAPSVSATNGGPVTYTVTYTGASNITLADGDINVVGSGGPTGDPVVSGSGTTERTVTISNIVGDGSMRFFISAGTATDAVGNSAAAVPPGPSFIVDNTPPTVSVDSLLTADSTPTLTGSYEGAQSVAVVVNSLSYAASLNSGTWTATVTAVLTDDFYDVVATATDGVGNTAEDPTSSELQVAATPPDAPEADGGTEFATQDPTFEVCGTASANTVQILVDGVPFPYTPGSPTWCVELSPSDDKATTHTYDIVAVNSAGVESPPTTITIDFGAPGPGVPLRWGGAALVLAIVGVLAIRRVRARG